MSDRLNEVGKTLKHGKKEARYALDRYSENFPKIERVRDTVSAGAIDEPGPPISWITLPRDYIVHFKTKQPDNRVTLDLLFLLPHCGCSDPQSSNE